jgi:hypothetical protein
LENQNLLLIFAVIFSIKKIIPMNKIKQVKDYINPTSPFKIRYNYEIDVNMDLDEVPEEYRDFVFEQLLSDFKLELKSKVYKIDKEVLLK